MATAVEQAVELHPTSEQLEAVEQAVELHPTSEQLEAVELHPTSEQLEAVELHPTCEQLDGVDVVWQIPANPHAILFLAHSGYGSPKSYWPSHPNAPSCTGTPEHKILVRGALERGYAVIAIKSVSGFWDSWPVESSEDMKHVESILTSWKAKHGLNELPVSALGSSSGGDFVAALPHKLKIKALIVMISKGTKAAFEAAVAGDFPPTLFVTMTEDEATVSGVQTAMAILKEKGVITATVKRPPMKVHPHFFASHIDEIDEETSAKFHSVLLEHDIVDAQNKLLRTPKGAELTTILRKAGLVNHEEEEAKVAEEINADRTEWQQSRTGDGPRRGRGHGGRDGGREGGGPRPGRSSLVLAIDNQFRVAEGRHTLTAHKLHEIFDWLEGKTWQI